MKETGIIMSGNHPKLILNGLKTMTRRTWGLKKINEDPTSWELFKYDGEAGLWLFSRKEYDEVLGVKCPYGGVGDRLWVRETYALEVIKGGGAGTHWDEEAKLWFLPRYKADGYDIGQGFDMEDGGVAKWCPSLFMPRWASRILLEITEVKAERLQSITEEDALAEGITIMQGTHQAFACNPTTGKLELVGKPEPYTARYHYEALWNSLNAERGYGWEKNPWVWVTLFKRIEG